MGCEVGLCACVEDWLEEMEATDEDLAVEVERGASDLGRLETEKQNKNCSCAERK